MNSYYISTAIRRNVDGKPDYIWVARYTNGAAIPFPTETEATEWAQRKCDDDSRALYSPAAVLVHGR
ncbi:MAG: hypothetical protein VW405_04965 [Rhodospirillaceae bacterium]